jgi:hypothetical protein
MYIRRTHTNNSSTGERYYTYRLVASQRVDGKPRQMTLLNLARHFAVDQDLWAKCTMSCILICIFLSQWVLALVSFIDAPASVSDKKTEISAKNTFCTS